MKKKLILLFAIFGLIFANITPHIAEAKTESYKANYYIKSKSAKIYKSAKTTSKVVTTVNKSTKVKTTYSKKVKGVTWYKVTVSKKKGWIKASSVSKTKPLITTSHKKTYYMKSKGKVYKSPKTSSKVVLSLKKSSKIKSSVKTKVNGVTWYKITAGNKKGWVKASAVTKTKPIKTTSHKKTYYMKSNGKIYQSPKTSSKAVLSLKKNSKIKSTAKANVNGVTWYKVTADNKKGWIKASSVSTKKAVVKKQTNLDKLKKVAKKYGTSVKYQKIDKYTKEYLFKKGYEESWIVHYSRTKATGMNVHYVKGKYITAPPALSKVGIDSAIALGYPVTKTELTTLAKKAQANPHKTYFAKSKKVTVVADRGKQLYINYYEDPNFKELLY